ncbi:14278_t:CDS:2, partial [Funneliformis mosseae]
SPKQVQNSIKLASFTELFLEHGWNLGVFGIAFLGHGWNLGVFEPEASQQNARLPFYAEASQQGQTQ